MVARFIDREPLRRVRASSQTLCLLPALFTTICAFSFVGVTAEQQRRESRILRFGDVGRSLAEREITQIADLADAAGKPAWLVLGFHSMLSGVAMLNVYLRPDATTERLHRGRMLRLVAKDAPIVPERSDWSVKSTASYAYVPLAEPTGEIADDQDLQWPFEVDGEVDDETLISLVTFVRSRPALPGVPEDRRPREVMSAPLSGVWRRGDEFIVGLRLREWSQLFRVTIIRKGGRWVVTKWNMTVV
jgi:hypothetical protein